MRLVLLIALTLGGCAIHHSSQALWADPANPPSPEATFVTEEDSGFGVYVIIGMFLFAEPDHYAVLLERMRRRHNCGRIHHVQFDTYVDVWMVIGFPIARVTAACEPATAAP